MPFYINANYDPAKIVRTIIVWPGKPRDSWAYTNYVQNALNVLVTRGTNQGIDPTTVLMIGPAWLNTFDQVAGAANPTDLIYHRSNWNSGGVSNSPNLTHSVPSYTVVDELLNMVFNNKTFPNMKNAVVMGHSMGAQATQRYAVLKRSMWFDDNVMYWIGNPGSYAWLTPDRPYPNASCPNVDEWLYGLRGNQSKITKYARKDVEKDIGFVMNRFRTRKIHYAFGLLDNGIGDTHCEAGTQGVSHLSRGTEFVQMLGGMAGGFPTTHTVDFMANTSHQVRCPVEA